MNHLKIALLLISLLLPTMAKALDCDNTMSTLEMRECENISYQKSDKELNDTYKKLMPKLDKTGQDLLISAEKSWIDFRDKNCAFSSDEMRDGTGQPLLYLGCLNTMTQARTKELNDYLNTYK